jgi:hypothetical protein
VVGVPAPAKAKAVVVTLLRREDSCGDAVHRQQERQAPAWEVRAPPGLVPTVAKKRASRHAPEKPQAAKPGPATAARRKAGAGNPTGATAEPTPQKWCPLHETSLHDATACRHISHLGEIRKERHAKHAAVGATHNC